MQMAKVKVIYYLDVLSSWCLIAEDAVERIRKEFGDKVEVDWRIAALRIPLNYTPEQLAWYYRRTESVSGVRLNPVWLESTADGTGYANLAAEAARGLGCVDDRVRLALARGAMMDGRHGARRDVNVDIAAAAGSLDRAKLDREMDDPKTAARIRATSDEFAKLGVEVRPTFVLENGIGDRFVLSGCWRYDVLSKAVGGLVDDEVGYVNFTSSSPPPAGTK
jgi:predicted DsbA family dithiol-disulfide isomerase